jgi:hypothetical protein
MKKLAYLLLSCAALATASCSKDKGGASPTIAPKDYQVEYRITSTSDLVADYVSYTNATGGTTTLNAVPLPASYSFTRNMKQGDSSTMLASVPSATGGGNVTVSILLDGKEVKKETGTGVRAQAVPVWVIGQ